jgi:quercetin dioxygenase-like cupin family protein
VGGGKRCGTLVRMSQTRTPPLRDLPSRLRVRYTHREHPGECGAMIRAYRLFTSPDGDSHVERGSVNGEVLVGAETIMFKETPAHSSFDWHNDPTPQYVITLAGILEFTTKGGETFTIHPGDILLAVDHTGTGHKWRLIDDEPWKRAYVIFKTGVDTQFVADKTSLAPEST